MANLHWNSEGTGQILPPPIDLPSERRQNKSKEPLNGFSQFLKSYWLLLLLGAGAIIIGLLPYRFNSGGSIQLYPPKQQLISSDVAGTLKKVFFPGGNGKFIKAGEVIAVLDSPELQNQLLTSQDKVTQQAATVREDEANLQKLLNTPRPEDIAVAKEKVSIARNNVNVAANQVQVARSNVMLAANQVQVARSNTRVAIQKVEISRSNLKVAQTQLVTGASEADYSRREAERYKESYEGGVYSLQQYESQQKKADTDALQIDTFKSSIDQARSQLETSKQDLVVAENNLASAQQQLVISKNTLEVSLQQLNTAKSQLSEEMANYNKVMAGPHPDEIQAAREKLQASQADLKRQKQDLVYYQDQVKRTYLRMPFDGVLSTDDLDTKIGQYVNKGDTFATANLNKGLTAEVKLPENVLDTLAPNNNVNIRFYTFYNEPFTGKVISVQTVAEKDTTYGTQQLQDQTGKTTQTISESAGQILKVTIQVDDPQHRLRPGMTGYAKIEGPTMPVFIAFTRPIVRFFQVDFWSWYP